MYIERLLVRLLRESCTVPEFPAKEVKIFPPCLTWFSVMHLTYYYCITDKGFPTYESLTITERALKDLRAYNSLATKKSCALPVFTATKKTAPDLTGCTPVSRYCSPCIRVSKPRRTFRQRQGYRKWRCWYIARSETMIGGRYPGELLKGRNVENES